MDENSPPGSAVAMHVLYLVSACVCAREKILWHKDGHSHTVNVTYIQYAWSVLCGFTPKIWLLRHLTYMVTHVPTHSLAHLPCAHAADIPAALSRPPEPFPLSLTFLWCFSADLSSFPSRIVPHRAKSALPALGLHPRRSLQFIVVIATGCSWPSMVTFSPIIICHVPGASGCAPTLPWGTDPCTAPSTLPKLLRVHGGVNLEPVLPGMAA